MKKKLSADEMSHSDAEYEYFCKFRNSVEFNKNKSQDDFEKYINLWSSGGVVISLVIAGKLIEHSLEVTFKVLFILGLISFLITILSNLYSHNKSIKDSDYILTGAQNYDQLFDEDFAEKNAKNNRTVTLLNDISLFSFVTGIICILAFVTINFLNMSNENTPKQNPPKDPKPLTEEKGRTNPVPAKVITPKK